MKELIIILPTHKRHEYLESKIAFYANCGYDVYICDSTSKNFEYAKQMPTNIHYQWMPNCGFYDKVYNILNHISSKLVVLTPDDDFLEIDTLNECKSKMLANANIALSVGRQAFFNNPYDEKWYILPTANSLIGCNLSQNKMKNAKIFGSHYQNVLWSMYRQDVVYKAFKKLKHTNPQNGNFIELTLACEATVNGYIHISPNIFNYRENLTTRSHWGQECPQISLENMAKDKNLRKELHTFIDQYKDDERKIVKTWVDTYLNANHITLIGKVIRKIRWILAGKKYRLNQLEPIEKNIKIDKILKMIKI